MTTEELKQEIYNWMPNKPKNWREGQAVFNYVDQVYGVARDAQFGYDVDCFYDDSKIDAFIETCAEIFTKVYEPIQKIKDVISASILCLRFPFLYPRNRFDGKHHADVLGTWCWKLKQKAIRDILILPKLNREINSSSKFLTFFDYTAKLDAHSRILTIKSPLETKEIDLSGYCSDKFEILGLRLNFSISGNIIINIIVEPFDGNDTTNYGFGGKRADFITSKWYYFWYKTISWINEQILDRICILPSYTELDAMESGWRKAFGIQMCKEIRRQLIKEKKLFKWRIVQLKEKFSGMRLYSNFASDELYNIIDKYVQISYRTCGVCGKPATKISKGWIYPYCDDCIGDRNFTEIK